MKINEDVYIGETGKKLKDLSNLLDNVNITNVINSNVIDFNGTAANASGYKEFTITIPAGCVAIGGPHSSRVGNSNGLQLTVFANEVIETLNRTESLTSTVFVNYYAPKAITRETSTYLRYICFKIK